MKAVALSTRDNPYNPLLDYTHWYLWDTQAGYNTAEYLARIVRTSDDLSYADQQEAIEMAIDEILELNLTGNYIKVEADIDFIP